MLRLASQLYGMPIQSLQIGRPIGEVVDILIDANELTLTGFFCEIVTSDEEVFLHKEDVRKATPDGFIVDSEESLFELDDLVRIQDLVEMDFQLFDKKVVTEKGRKVGRVTDYIVEDQTFFIEQLYVGQSMLKNLATGRRVIGRQQIISVSEKKVTVESGILKTPAVRPKLQHRKPATSSERS